MGAILLWTLVTLAVWGWLYHFNKTDKEDFKAMGAKFFVSGVLSAALIFALTFLNNISGV